MRHAQIKNINYSTYFMSSLYFETRDFSFIAM